MYKQKVISAIFIVFEVTAGLEYNKQQRYNSNHDFLLHESGVPTSGKKETSPSQPLNSLSLNPQNSNQNTAQPHYDTQFSQLGQPKPSQLPNPTNNNLRNSQSFNAKRDYVAPQSPTVKPVDGNNQQSGGKVKDLINLYDKKNSDQKVPSYSSILQSSAHKNELVTSTIQTTPKPSSMPTPKPLSFSAVVAGPNVPKQNTLTTTKPSTKIPSISSTPKLSNSESPSQIANRNKNNQGTNSATNRPSDAELKTLSEELLRKDINNAAKYITINYQEKTTSQSKEDKAPGPLLTVTSEAWNIPTIQKLLPLLDNYERDTMVNEYVTPQERNEENVFMDAIMATTVIRHLMNFLKDKGYVTPDPRQQRDFLKQLWFTLYSRGKGKIGSSGFEHIFVSELKNSEVSGLHSWIYFSKEEAANRLNYLGYLKYAQLNDRGAIIKLHFNQQGVDKPVDTMFIGTSPELEIALYTLCFVTRADSECKLKLANNDIDIVTHTFRYRSKNLIGSAYPQLPVVWR